MGITERNPTYGNYEDGPQYNIAVDNNPRYGENVNKWEGGVVTDVNHEYQMVTDVNCEYQMASWLNLFSILQHNLWSVKNYAEVFLVSFGEFYSILKAAGLEYPDFSW